MGLLSGGRLLVAAVVVTALAVSNAQGNLFGPPEPPLRVPGVPGPASPAGQAAAEQEPVGSTRPVSATGSVTSAGAVPWEKPGPFGSRRTTGTPYAALTFDDGPDPRWTPDVLALLRAHAVRATFCVVGERAAAHPDLVRVIAADGHTLCNHSWRHDLRLGARSRNAIREDLERTNAAIRAAVPHVPVSYFRAPGGRWTGPVVEIAAGLGMASLHWTVDPQDWREPGGSAIVESVVPATTRGAIVLLHDGGGDRAGTVLALARILPELTGRMPLDALPAGPDPREVTGGAS